MRLIFVAVGGLLLAGVALSYLYERSTHLKAPSVLVAPVQGTTSPAGPAPRATPSTASRSRPQGEWLGPFDITAYAHTGYRTSSGKWPAAGMCASNLFPMGTRLLVENLGVFVVEDHVGGGTDVDIYLGTRKAAIRFGRKHLRVKVLHG